MVSEPVSMRGQRMGSLVRSSTPALEYPLVKTLDEIMVLLTRFHRHVMELLVAKKLRIMVLLTRLHRHAMVHSPAKKLGRMKDTLSSLPIVATLTMLVVSEIYA